MSRIAFLIPRYVGGGAEGISCLLARGLGDAEIWATRFDPHTRANLNNMGFVTASPRDIIPGVTHRSTRAVEAVAELVRRRGIDVLVVAVSPLSDMPRLRRLVSGNVKIIFHLHSVPMWETLALRSWSGDPRQWLRVAKERLFHTYSRRALRQYRQTLQAVDACITLCPGYAKQLADIASHNDKITAIYNPVDLSRFHSAPKERRILYVGRMTHGDKRADRLIRIWAQIASDYPEWHLDMVGDGPCRRSLEKMAARLCPGRVTFHGYGDPVPYYARASVVAMTSTYEGWPGVLVEALASGCRPIAYNSTEGIAEILGQGRGTLVPPFDCGEYVRQLRQLLDNYSENGATIPSEWLGTLSPEKIVAQWHKLCQG